MGKGKRRAKLLRKSSRRGKRPAVVEFEPIYNLCYAADRQEFYERIIRDRRRALERLTPAEQTALYVEINMAVGNKSRKYRGRLRFYRLGKLENFLLIGVDSEYKKQRKIDWSKRGMCQYQKTAGMFVEPSHPRKPRKVIRRYRLES